ncbi:MAG: MBL fold metallo-hydrolase [Schwartzia sp.]|nr:MBL fold metallo-hydrolase [Schwartzia sp. (in: firmicutes)]
MRQLIFLGTGAAMATECYNACFLVRTPDDEYFLTDAGGGNGVLGQMKCAGVPFEHLRVLFITHGHSDHILGAIWVIRRIASLMNKDIYDGEFHIYCHDVACEIIEMMAQMLLSRAELSQYGKRILLHEIHDGEQVHFLNMKLTAFDIRSRKAKQFGYRLRFANRRCLVCLGDEPYNERCRAYAEKADWLVAEAFCLDADAERFRPHDKNHGTVREAAMDAEKLSAKHLVLYHTEDTDLKHRKARYRVEAAAHYGGEIFVPDDLDVIDID